ncbi:hypothetical protein MIT9_P0805 [Methylomarinovum caldicuralii]|uniref:DUF3450 domain-containing protein n=1 Tax=Methylomarinovum caldicuralii TaxID=438856 RepID=A0AAU9BYR5_9GAMM|nr:DUF3450 domain-containing protein [Methylomarinovum caldicuralii]BCX81227.1 hypothetical protein MIT9_P0805 [Methylomarinovum caldicuralii]
MTRSILLAGWLVPALVWADPVGRAIDLQVQTQQDSAKIQKRIDQLDDETRRMVAEYRAKLAELDELERYNGQLEKLVADQQQELALRERQLAELETLKRRLFPFMLEMLTALEKIVEVDTPFLTEERRQRVKALRELMNRADVALPEKYRRLMEAFRIEARYGHNTETYEGPLVNDGRRRTVRFLRFGRTGLYYLTLDGHEAGMWDENTRSWRRLGKDFLRPLDHALRIAAKQAPPDLVVLPVPAPEVP